MPPSSSQTEPTRPRRSDNEGERFIEALARATAGITSEYFAPSAAGGHSPVYRERVYCYELYHQLRSSGALPAGLQLAGELDKRAHPTLPTKLAKIPDFVLHVPGRMDRNICVVEVKCVARVDRRSARKDLEKLIAYVSYGRYQCGVYLTVGVGAGDRVRRYAQEFIRRLGGITLLEHREAGREATAVPWSLVVTERP